ncbi:tail completion protein gp17 [Aquabacterium sp. OR-4]|uniref:tail completion protein gp17 n=1 Tax=Aquabacterium sp. OR-4 TaxID=2978127 RepID=UPI0021B47C03|nr:DUF3168 domain-containing protein [Aquabacterium sp. OR-4]MDT7836456.1 DUF3168 domain-containing protein [Aquabacterium sp. OR-4]
MSIETDFRALLAADAGVIALAGTAIAHNAIGQGVAPPYVVFTAQHDRLLGLDNTVLADQCVLTVQCWARKVAEAEALADAVVAAVATAPARHGACVTARASAYDEETGLDATVLTVEWWA